MDQSFVKGHGTENDFVVLPDASGGLELTDEQVRRICDRRAGLGADGVIRAVRTDATDDPAAVAARGEAVWFMDYRNADGSVAQMCGNGARVFALYLATHADVDPRNELKIATRAGIKTVTFDADGISVNMGVPQVFTDTTIGVGESSWPARHISMGNPHAVVFVDTLDDAGPLQESPTYDETVYPDGVNVEFVVRRGEQHVAMRVHERGAGETRSCGTGTCAVLVATALADQADPGTAYTVDVPGGQLQLVWRADGDIVMTGPAELVAEGTLTL